MMKNFLPKLAIAVAGVVLSFAAKAPAQAVTFTFSIDGFSGDGILSGSFSGEDLNGDGFLNLVRVGTPGVLSGEIDDYEATWSGNSIVSAFTHRLGEASLLEDTPLPLISQDITYSLRDRLFLWNTSFGVPDFGTQIVIDSSQAPEAGFSASVAINTFAGPITDTTNKPVKVVPEPSSMLGLSLAGLLGFLFHKKLIN